MGPQVENPDSFGQFLRRERELREIKLEEIAAYTRIKVRALQAIEQDDFASLPPLAFVRAFVRCYADYIGLGIPDVMLRFDGFVQSRYPELTGEVPVIKGPKPQNQRYVVGLLVLVVIALAVLAWWMSRSEVKTPTPTTPSPPTSPATILGSTSGTLPPTADVLNIPAQGSAPTPATGTTAKPAQPATPKLSHGSTQAATALPTVRPLSATPVAFHGSTQAAITVPGGITTFAPRIQVSPSPGSTAAADLKAPKPIQPKPGSKHFTVITVRKDCWVKYSVDGKKGAVTLRSGQSLRLDGAQEVMVTFGNPAALASFSHNQETVELKPKCYPQYFYFPPRSQTEECPPKPVVQPESTTPKPVVKPGAKPTTKPTAKPGVTTTKPTTKPSGKPVYQPSGTTPKPGTTGTSPKPTATTPKPAATTPSPKPAPKPTPEPPAPKPPAPKPEPEYVPLPPPPQPGTPE